MTPANTTLRPYPRNSPEAAARVVAMALIANGRVKAVETAALQAHQAHQRLGLTQARWHGVIHELCSDLLGAARSDDDCCVSDELLAEMLDAVDDDALRRRVLQLCSVAIHADRQIDDGESFVLLAAVDRWGLDPDNQALLEPLLYGRDFQVRLRGRVGEAGHRLRLS